MPRGYSRDLRERLLAMVESGLPIAEVARRTKISPSSLWRWRMLAAANQSLSPKASPGGPRKIGPDLEAALRAQVTATPDATLAEHVATWERAGHAQVSVATMGRALLRLGLPLKKRR
jgi:transposase-like protein